MALSSFSVFALYHRHRNVRRAVLVLFAFEIICMAVGLSLANPMYTFDEMCIVVNAPAVLNTYGGGTIGFQAILFGLTIYRTVQDLRSGWTTTPLGKLLVRDGTWAFLLFLCEVAFPASRFAR
ncbi:hypothetical protein CPC08DRAFT_631809 [Agrocybe pediades]|nr:hypothetical protein CPC08DRAFT_631809 [Agrocybe pediades]